MKYNKSIEKVIHFFPMLPKYMEVEPTIVKEKLSEVEFVFYELCLFFQNPQNQTFDISSIYRHLEGKNITLALDSLQTFFKEDTYLMPEEKVLTIYEHDPLVNQTEFSQFLLDNGLSYDLRKLNVYYKRGLLPTPNVVIGGKPYWLESSVRNFLHEKI